MNSVVIIESPGKLKKFKAALGSGYTIFPTAGHCIDLPVKKLSINIKKNFEPTFEVKPDRQDKIKELKKIIKNAKFIYMMTDCDREGEAISWHIKNELEGSTKALWLRATTNEITKSGILKAIQNPGDIDMQKINAYLCRRLLDRLCGYKTSYLTKQATGGRSAGRVQSAMLRVIADREIEIKNFNPEEYWVLTAKFLNSKGSVYFGTLEDKIKVPNAKEATKIYDAVIAGSPVITELESKDVQLHAYAPFVTATMVQSASTLLGWGVKRMEKTAQALYESGSITYHRTDSPFMATEAVESVRAFITHHHAPEYLPAKANYYKPKSGAQEAHECCRPTDFSVQSVGSGDMSKLYEMIWRRAVASQMTPGKDRRTKVVTAVAKYLFITKGNVRLFDGFRLVWNYSSADDAMLPDLFKGEKCSLVNLAKEQKFTLPPPRYSDASLSKRCDKEQIARPATFGNFVEALKNRGYITQTKKTFHATDLGINVIDFLKTSDMCFVDIKFTAKMETLLDEIAEDKKTKEEILAEFWARLKIDIEKGKEVRDKKQLTDHDCPKCKGKLLKKHSQFGAFFACQNWSSKKDDDNKCSFIATVGDKGEPVPKKPPAPKEYTDFKCKKCDSKMIKRKSSYGEFAGCEKFPICRAVADLEGNFKESTKKKWKGKKK